MSHVTPGTSSTAAFASGLPLCVALRAAVVSRVISRSAKTVLFAIVSGTKAAKSDANIA